MLIIKSISVGLIMSVLAACTAKPQSISKDASIPMQVAQSVYAHNCYEDIDSAELQNQGIGNAGYVGHMALGVFSGVGVFGGLAAAMGADSRCGFEYSSRVAFIESEILVGDNFDARRDNAIQKIVDTYWALLDISKEDIKLLESSCDCTFTDEPALVEDPYGNLLYGYLTEKPKLPHSLPIREKSLVGLKLYTYGYSLVMMPDISLSNYSDEFQDLFDDESTIVPLRYTINYRIGKKIVSRVSKPTLPNGHFLLLEDRYAFYRESKKYYLIMPFSGFVSTEKVYLFATPIDGSTPYMNLDSPGWIDMMTPKGFTNPI